MSESIVQPETESGIKPELLSLKSKLANEIDGDEKQVQALLKRIEANKSLFHAVNQSLGTIMVKATGYGAWVDTVLAAIVAVEKDEFEAVDVENAFRHKFPTAPMDKGRIRGTLWMLGKKKQKIMVMRKGTNRVPALYLKLPEVGGEVSEAPRRRASGVDSLPRRRTKNLVPANGEAGGAPA